VAFRKVGNEHSQPFSQGKAK